MKADFQNSSETTIATPSTTPEAMAAGRLRPARLTRGGTGVAAAPPRGPCGAAGEGSGDGGLLIAIG
jgi:hypothetical protein